LAVFCCFIYDHTGAQVDAISNTKELNKFAARQYFSALLGIALCARVGMALIWIAYRIWLIVAPAASVDKPPVFGWLYWLSYAAVGLLLVALLVYLLSMDRQRIRIPDVGKAQLRHFP